MFSFARTPPDISHSCLFCVCVCAIRRVAMNMLCVFVCIFNTRQNAKIVRNDNNNNNGNVKMSRRKTEKRKTNGRNKTKNRGVVCLFKLSSGGGGGSGVAESQT